MALFVAGGTLSVATKSTPSDAEARSMFSSLIAKKIDKTVLETMGREFEAEIRALRGELNAQASAAHAELAEVRHQLMQLRSDFDDLQAQAQSRSIAEACPSPLHSPAGQGSAKHTKRPSATVVKAMLDFKDSVSCGSSSLLPEGQDCLDSKHLGSWVWSAGDTAPDPCADGWAGVCCARGGWRYDDPANPHLATSCGDGNGGGTVVTGLDLGGWGTFYTTYSGLSADLSQLAPVTTLETLNLQRHTGLTGDLSTMSGMPMLSRLDLGLCPAITGQLSALSHLTNLAFLNLAHCTSLGGDARDLMGLSQLSWLRLSGTATIAMSCDALCEDKFDFESCSC
eukprot:SAG11_NODE_3862_length_2184_cov_3.657554_1_plen_340_part_00